MEELLALERKTKKIIEGENKRLLALGYTQEDLDILDNALKYIAFPIIAEFYEEDNDELEDVKLI